MQLFVLWRANFCPGNATHIHVCTDICTVQKKTNQIIRCRHTSTSKKISKDWNLCVFAIDINSSDMSLNNRTFHLHAPKAIIGYKVVIHSVLADRHNSTALCATFNYLVSAIQNVCSGRRQIFCSDSSPASIKTIALLQKGPVSLSRCICND